MLCCRDQIIVCCTFAVVFFEWWFVLRHSITFLYSSTQALICSGFPLWRHVLNLVNTYFKSRSVPEYIFMYLYFHYIFTMVGIISDLSKGHRDKKTTWKGWIAVELSLMFQTKSDEWHGDNCKSYVLENTCVYCGFHTSPWLHARVCVADWPWGREKHSSVVYQVCLASLLLMPQIDPTPRQTSHRLI